MLSYQHVYHAGNHADILKHCVLISVMEHLNQKEKPYAFFDTHSGGGLYSLEDERVMKTLEAKNGVEKLFDFADDFPPELESYKNLVQPYLKQKKYPGSPFLESALARKDDFIYLSELHPQVYSELEQNMLKFQKSAKTCANLSLHKRNGFEMLKGMAPPKCRRGAVLIDPSYEDEEEYDDVVRCVSDTFKKWSGATYMVWYPLLSYRMGRISSMLDALENSVKAVFPNTELADFRLCVAEENEHTETSLEKSESPRLFGSGMFVINPPWKLSEKMNVIVPFLESKLKR